MEKWMQYIKVHPSENEGMVYVIQSTSLDKGRQYWYEVPVEHIEATIKELKTMHENMVEQVIMADDSKIEENIIVSEVDVESVEEHKEE